MYALGNNDERKQIECQQIESLRSTVLYVLSYNTTIAPAPQRGNPLTTVLHHRSHTRNLAFIRRHIR